MNHQVQSHRGFITVTILYFSIFFLSSLSFSYKMLVAVKKQIQYIETQRHCHYQASSGLLTATVLSEYIQDIDSPLTKAILYKLSLEKTSPFQSPRFALFKTDTKLFSVHNTSLSRCILVCNYTQDDGIVVLSDIMEFEE